MTTTRKDAITALLAQLTPAYGWAGPILSRLKLWGEVPLASRPAAFLCQNGQETYTYNGTLRIRVLEFRLFIYTDAKVSTVNGADEQNLIMEALDAALSPQGADASTGRNTLGNVVHNCRIEGNVEREPGDLDGDAILIIPIKVLLP